MHHRCAKLRHQDIQKRVQHLRPQERERAFHHQIKVPTWFTLNIFFLRNGRHYIVFNSYKLYSYSTNFTPRRCNRIKIRCNRDITCKYCIFNVKKTCWDKHIFNSTYSSAREICLLHNSFNYPKGDQINKCSIFVV